MSEHSGHLSFNGTGDVTRVTLNFISGYKLLICMIVWPLAVFITCFVLFGIYNWNETDDNYGVTQIPTLSLSGNFSPGDRIFTLGLHVEGFMLWVFFFSVFTMFKAKIRSSRINKIELQNSRLDNWNFVILCFGMTCSVLMMLVGTVSMSTSLVAHGIIAFFMFLFAIVHMVLVFYILLRDIDVSARQIKEIRLCIFMCIPFNILMGIIGVIVRSSCSQRSCLFFAAELGPCLEFVTTIFLMVYVLSYRSELEYVSLEVVALPATALPMDRHPQTTITSPDDETQSPTSATISET